MPNNGMNKEYRLVAFNARYTHSCAAIFYVRQELERYLPDSVITLQQWTINDPYYATLLKITANSPAVILFSVYIWNSSRLAGLIRDIRQLLPESRLILGGPQAGRLLKDNKDISGCVLVSGEIEAVDPGFYDDLVTGMLGPHYGTHPDRQKEVTFPSPYRQSDFRAELSNRHIYYESSRGCPFTCTYCLSSEDIHVRHKDLPQVEEEVSAILRQRPRVVRFIDRTFNDLPERALHIWRFLAEQPGSTLFHFEVAPDRFTDQMFSFLKGLPANRFQFEIGVQSTNAGTLKEVRRKSDIDKSRENITRLAALDNIHLHVDLILGLPGEGRNSFRQSFCDVFAMQPHYIQMGLLKILPDTRISRSTEEYGIIFRQGPPYEILANRWMSHAELAELYWFGECVEAFYNNRFFRSIWKYLLQRQEDPCSFFSALLDICRQHDFFELAATQELMGRMLLALFEQRQDRQLLNELLVYDWLRSANRQLPSFLLWENDSNEQSALKKKLRLKLPQNRPGLYDHADRDRFLKRASFIELSGETLEFLGMADHSQAGIVVVLRERQDGVFNLLKTVLLDYE